MSTIIRLAFFVQMFSACRLCAEGQAYNPNINPILTLLAPFECLTNEK